MTLETFKRIQGKERKENKLATFSNRNRVFAGGKELRAKQAKKETRKLQKQYGL